MNKFISLSLIEYNSDIIESLLMLIQTCVLIFMEHQMRILKDFHTVLFHTVTVYSLLSSKSSVKTLYDLYAIFQVFLREIQYVYVRNRLKFKSLSTENLPLC